MICNALISRDDPMTVRRKSDGVLKPASPSV
jgi:hypothetical protein